MPGNSIRSDDRRFTFVMQFDGNLVLYGPQNQPLWASNTAGQTTIFDGIMQGDGNLVLYNGQNQPLWASNTSGKPGAWLIAQNDGNVVIYNTKTSRSGPLTPWFQLSPPPPRKWPACCPARG